MSYLPLKLINKWSNQIPTCWDEIEDMRKLRGNKLPDWDPACYSPIAGAIAVVSRGGEVTPDMIIPAAELAALAPWRQYKEAYRFTAEMQELLFEQADDCVIPIEIIKNLPFPCIYVELHEDGELLKDNHGFFVHIEHDVNDGRKELRFLLLDNSGTTYPVAIHLYPGGTIRDGINAMLEEAEKQKIKASIRTIHDIDAITKFSDDIAVVSSKLLQLVLYICADNTEIDENPKQQKITRRAAGPVKDKFREVRKWDVGIRTTKLIRNIKSSDRYVHYNDVTQGTPKRPHVRRGHYHHYWIGPRDSSERKLVLRWVAPTFINMNKSEDTPVVIRKIDKK